MQGRRCDDASRSCANLWISAFRQGANFGLQGRRCDESFRSGTNVFYAALRYHANVGLQDRRCDATGYRDGTTLQPVVFHQGTTICLQVRHCDDSRGPRTTAQFSAFHPGTILGEQDRQCVDASRTETTLPGPAFRQRSIFGKQVLLFDEASPSLRSRRRTTAPFQGFR